MNIYMGKHADYNRFQRYGYIPLYPDAEYDRKKKIKVFNTILQKNQKLSYRKLDRWARRNHIVEVNPDLRKPYYNFNNDAKTQFINNQQEEFRYAGKQLIDKAFEISLKFWKAASGHKDFGFKYQENTTQAELLNKANLYALVDVLKRFPSHKDYRAVLIIHKRKMELYRYINIETIKHLEHMISYILDVNGEEDLLNDYSFSDMPILLALTNYDRIDVHFEKKTGKDKPGGGFFPYYNISGYDLTKYGIYTKDVFENKDLAKQTFKDNCFIDALKKSNVLTNEEIIFIQSSINTRVFPRCAIKKIAEQLQLDIRIYTFKENNKWDKKKIYKFGDRKIELCLYKNHYFLSEQIMLTIDYLKHKDIIDKDLKVNPLRKESIKYYWNENTNTKSSSYQYLRKPYNIIILLREMITANLLIPLTTEYYYNLCSTKQLFIDNDFTKLVNPELFVIPNKQLTFKQETKEVVFVTKLPDIEGEIYYNRGNATTLHTDNIIYKNINYVFPSMSLEHINDFKTIIQEHFNLNLDGFNSIAKLGSDILRNTGCYNDVYSISGYVKDFIGNCRAKPFCQTCYNNKFLKEGNLMQIDRNSCYCSCYKDFPGIPKGKPKIIENPTLDYDYYFICINILDYHCKFINDPFPLITETGIHYYDKIMMETILKYYNIEYEFISGYYFNEGFNTNINNLAIELYSLKNQYPELAITFKILINSLWGKSIQKKTTKYNVIIPDNKVDDFVSTNYEYIYQRRNENNANIFSLYKPFSVFYNQPQFGIPINNYAKCFMASLIYDLQIPIYYCNTDSLLFDFENLYKVKHLIGEELGKFHIEFQDGKKFYGLSPRNYLVIYKDNNYRLRTSFEKIKDLEVNQLEIYFLEKLVRHF